MNVMVATVKQADLWRRAENEADDDMISFEDTSQPLEVIDSNFQIS